MHFADGANFTIDLEEEVAVVRVFRDTSLESAALGVAAEALLEHARVLTMKANVSGMILDLRRVPGAIGPRVEAAFGAIAALWEATGQSFAVLVGDTIQRMQVGRLVDTAAPRHGGVFERREDARKFAGASDTGGATMIGASQPHIPRKRLMSDPGT